MALGAGENELSGHLEWPGVARVSVQLRVTAAIDRERGENPLADAVRTNL